MTVISAEEGGGKKLYEIRRKNGAERAIARSVDWLSALLDVAFVLAAEGEPANTRLTLLSDTGSVMLTSSLYTFVRMKIRVLANNNKSAESAAISRRPPPEGGHSSNGSLAA